MKRKTKAFLLAFYLFISTSLCGCQKNKKIKEEENQEVIDMKDNENKETVTSHTTNLVPFIVTKKDIELIDGSLCDIAPTILSLLNLEKPNEMTGTKLIK